MANVTEDINELEHNAQGVTVETQHAKNAEIGALKNTIKMMKLEHKKTAFGK